MDAFVSGSLTSIEPLNCRMNDAHDRTEWPLTSPVLTARMFDNV